MKIESLTCPNCGGILDGIEIQDGKSNAFCPYCGTKIQLTDENTKTYIHKHVDTAREKEIELRKTVESYKYERRKSAIDILDKERKSRKKVFLICLAGMVVTLLGFMFGVTSDYDSIWYEIGTACFVAWIFFTLGTIIFGLTYWSKNRSYHKLTTRID